MTVLLSVALILSLTLPCAASTIQNLVTFRLPQPEQYKTAYSAKYSITVDRWDFVLPALDPRHSLPENLTGTIVASVPYQVAPTETTLYLLENGNYWSDALYQHTKYQEITTPDANGTSYAFDRFEGFRGSYMNDFFYFNTADVAQQNTLPDITDTKYTFTVQGRAVESIDEDGLYDRTDYGNAFEITGGQPSAVEFTVIATGRASWTTKTLVATFHGVIHYTEIQEIKQVKTLPGKQTPASFWNWVLFIFLFGWIWME
ncbi:MAG: hypothetical protein LBS96_07560 [Oscillospiraceae bacterium]|nr:hypothetical protein [Oscillospiraceae bacterium]